MAATPDKVYDGAILHADGMHVFQQAGKGIVRHDAERFPERPEIGTQLALKDDGVRVLAVQAEVKRSRSVRR